MQLCRVAAIALWWTLCACGGAHVGGDDVDAATDSSDVDAATDGNAQLTCDYQEAADATNNLISGAEVTNKSVGARLTLCGNVNTGHYDAANEIVDADGYSFSVASDSDVLVHLVGAGINAPQQMILEIAQGTTFYGFGVVEGDHGTLMAHLPAGTYVAAVAALNPADLGATGEYKLTIVPDTTVATRCSKLSSAADWTEKYDGASSVDNDVVAYNSTSNTPSSLTTSTTDAPESTALAINTGAHKRITGLSGLSDPADDYEDRDTFSFTTGAATTQMTIRLNWGSTTMDLDYRVYPFPSSGVPLSIAGGLDQSLMEEELETFAVKPNTLYWLWIAAEDGATGQPSAYDATLCGDVFTP